jgi:hypothetical protein
VDDQRVWMTQESGGSLAVGFAAAPLHALDPGVVTKLA